MGVGKYSPTVSHSYAIDQGWWERNNTGENLYDNDGYDSYGYNKDGLDRAGYSEQDYESDFHVDDETGEVHYFTYDSVAIEYRTVRLGDLNKFKNIINSVPLFKDYLKEKSYENIVYTLRDLVEKTKMPKNTIRINQRNMEIHEDDIKILNDYIGSYFKIKNKTEDRLKCKEKARKTKIIKEVDVKINSLYPKTLDEQKEFIEKMKAEIYMSPFIDAIKVGVLMKIYENQDLKNDYQNDLEAPSN